MTLWMTLGILAALAATVITLVVFRLRSGHTISSSERERIARAWRSAESQIDPIRRILEADKALDLALSACGFTGSLGDKLKAAGPRFGDIDAVWRAHKLRNRLAHEAHADVKKTEADTALRAFKKGIEEVIGGRIEG